jgi:hypothetical protein
MTEGTGIWLGASLALDRTVPVDEPYPHICGRLIKVRAATRQCTRITRAACGACGERDQPAIQDQTKSGEDAQTRAAGDTRDED